MLECVSEANKNDHRDTFSIFKLCLAAINIPTIGLAVIDTPMFKQLNHHQIFTCQKY